jgi:hypothetical protein
MSDNILKQITDLKNKSVKELKALYTSLYNEESTLNSKQQLIRDIAYRLQELEYGFLSDKHNKKLYSFIKEAAKGKKFCKVRYYKSVNGTKIFKKYHEQKYGIETTSEGFIRKG